MININLTRLFFKPTYCIGRMTIRDIFSCDTLEDPPRDFNKDGDLDDPGEQKIPTRTAIPYGRYPVVVTLSPKFKRMLPFICNVPDFVGIRIHALNWPEETDGCIGVGENKTKGGLINSRKAEEKLTSILLDFQEEGEEIYINIV
jgi:hypothetical protein